MAAPPVKISRLTAAGNGAVAVLRLEGECLLPLLTRYLFHPSGRPISREQLLREADAAIHRPLFTHIPLASAPVTPNETTAANRSKNQSNDQRDNRGGNRGSNREDEQRNEQGSQPREEAVLYLPSRTRAELNCHGGDTLVEAVTALFVAGGAVLASDDIPQDEGFRASAKRLLPYAETDRAVEVLLDQLGGAAARFWRDLFSAIDSRRITSVQAAERLEEIASYESFGRHLSEPYRIVLAGRVNAGKSTLLNALVGYDRAITAPEAGTTRDAVTAETAFEGIAVRLYDTAGIRPAESGNNSSGNNSSGNISSGNNSEGTPDAIEREGICLAKSLLSGADLVLILHPFDAPGSEFSSEFSSELGVKISGKISDELTERLVSEARAGSEQCVVVHTKADLVPQDRKEGNRDKYQTLASAGPLPPSLTVSALDSDSVDQLEKQIARLLVPAPPKRGTPIPLTPGEAALYRRTAAILRAGNPLSATEREVIISRVES